MSLFLTDISKSFSPHYHYISIPVALLYIFFSKKKKKKSIIYQLLLLPSDLTVEIAFPSKNKSIKLETASTD